MRFLGDWILTNSVIRSYEKERDSLSADMRVMWNVYGWSCACSRAKGETKSHNIKAEKPQLVNRRMGRERKKVSISTNFNKLADCVECNRRRVEVCSQCLDSHSRGPLANGLSTFPSVFGGGWTICTLCEEFLWIFKDFSMLSSNFYVRVASQYKVFFPSFLLFCKCSHRAILWYLSVDFDYRLTFIVTFSHFQMSLVTISCP